MGKFILFVAAALAIAYFISFGWALGGIWMLFAFGTLWFYGLTGTLFILACWALYLVEDVSEEVWGRKQSPLGVSTAVFVAVLLALQFLSDVKPFSYFIWEPGWAFAAFFGYFVLGAAWSYVNWKYRWVPKKRRLYEKVKKEFCANHNILPTGGRVVITEHHQSAWQSYLISHGVPLRFNDDGIPIADSHKKKFYAWIAYWPISIAWMIINDPITKIVKTIYRWLAGAYQRALASAFADVREDFVPVTPADGDKPKTGTARR